MASPVSVPTGFGRERKDIMELTNTLGQSKSQYLKEASRQPVNWQSYSDDVFHIAKELDRPILLDIGAVWCHWCHVMDNESYTDEQVAAIINQSFVPVKVDRDQMPDVDARYQTAVGALAGTGGWPLTVFLTPDGKAFYGGTYFPKNDVQGRPGLLTMLPQIAEVYQKQKSEVYKSADGLFQQLRDYERQTGQPGELSDDIVQAIVGDARSKMDDQFGGFGSMPKFFTATALQLLVETALKEKDHDLTSFLRLTLENMMHGGVYDELGGGFHRYSVDRYWHVPHFEKMLYDNALLVKAYLAASKLGDGTAYAGTARQIADWITGTMKSPEGPFYSHQDADVGTDDDGSYWTWTFRKVTETLSEQETKAVELYYDIRERPDDLPGSPEENVLRVAISVEDIARDLAIPADQVASLISSSRAKLLEAREKRTAPLIDRTFFADRNGLAISALVEASLELNARSYFGAAEEAANFILHHMINEKGRVAHAFSDGGIVYHGLLDDQVYFGTALLDLFDVMRHDSHLSTAEKIAQAVLDGFEDREGGGFFDRPHDSKGEGALSSKRKPIDDTPMPSGNSSAAIFFDKLFGITENREYFDVAERTLKAFAGSAGKFGIYGANYARALNLHFAVRRNLK